MTDNIKILGWLMVAFVLLILHSCIDSQKATSPTSQAEYLEPQPVLASESIVENPELVSQSEALALQQQQLLNDYEVLQKRLEDPK